MERQPLRARDEYFPVGFYREVFIQVPKPDEVVIYHVRVNLGALIGRDVAEHPHSGCFVRKDLERPYDIACDDIYDCCDYARHFSLSVVVVSICKQLSRAALLRSEQLLVKIFFYWLSFLVSLLRLIRRLEVSLE